MEKKFEFLDHTADIQIHAWGDTLEEAFEQSVYGMMGVMIEKDTVIEEVISKSIVLSAQDLEILFVDYLTEYLGLFDMDRFLVASVKIEPIIFDETSHEYKIKSIAKGEKFDSNKHNLDTEVKAVTFSYLDIKKNEDKSEILFILDL